MCSRGIQAHAHKAVTEGLFPPPTTPDVLTGRKYLVVRAIGDSSAESGETSQKRLIQTYYEAIEEWDP